ncbi:MAG: ADOP family duplicated permease [Vicinamibacterales bacterium]
MPAWIRRLLARLRYRRFDQDLARELEVHRALKREGLVAAGLTPEEARARAARDMGNVTLAREEARRVWIASWAEGLWQDLRYAVAVSRRQPIFSLGAVLVLAVGIGLVSALFTFVHAQFLRPWQVGNPGSMALVRPRPAGLPEFGGISIAEARHLDAHATTVTHVIIAMEMRVTLRDHDGRAFPYTRAIYVTGAYFDAVGLPMAAGRGFMPGEDTFRSPVPVAVISDVMWRDHFGRNPAVLGRTLLIDARPFAIVGVAPRGFFDISGSRAHVWLPMTAVAITRGPEQLAKLEDPRLQTMPGVDRIAGRLAPRVSLKDAEAELTLLSRRFRLETGLPEIAIRVTGTAEISRGLDDEVVLALQLTFLALALIQLLACANVGNLLLARAVARRREMAIRLSLGAGRMRIVRQLLAEAALLAVVAGGLGLSLAFAVPAVIARIGADDLERPEFYAPDGRVFALAFGMAVLTALVCGLAPALRGSRVGLASAARSDRDETRGGLKLRRLLLASQIALATVLLTGAGLLTRAIDHAMGTDHGFAIGEIQTVQVTLPAGTPRPARLAFFGSLRRELQAFKSDLPPFAFSEQSPLINSSSGTIVRVPNDPERARTIRTQGVSRDYFNVLGVPIVAGRVASRDDDEREIVINESAARMLWPNENAIGKTLRTGFRASAMVTREVVGIAADVPVRSLEIVPVIYEGLDNATSVVLLRSLDPKAVQRIQAIVASIDSRATVSARPLTDNVKDLLVWNRAFSRLAWSLGALGLILATVGAFGVFAYAVEDRRREIGIRMALGARVADVVRVVVRTSQLSIALGLAFGLVVSLIAAPLLRSFLYGLSPFDPVAYAQIAAILFAAGAVATWIPARRAARIDPARTLRAD